jgi:hypothetical protein
MIARSRGSRLAEGRPLHRPVIYDEIHMRRAMQGHVEGLRSYKVPLTIQHVGLCISSGGHVGFRKGKRNFVYVVAFTERVCSCMLKPPARRSFPNNGDRELSALTPGKNFKARVGFSRITITTQSNFILANFEITANVCRLHPTSDSFNWKLLQHVIQIIHCTTCNDVFFLFIIM